MTDGMAPAREMRRKDRRLADAACAEILDKAEYGVLSTLGRDGVPYGIPLSFVRRDERICFHCAREGRKIDNLRFCRRASFAVVGATRPAYAGNFTTYYESVIVSGTVEEVTDPAEKRDALYALAAKYLPEHLDKAERDIAASFERTAVYALHPEHISGKAKKEKPVSGKNAV